jgi:hypothetical protein
MSDLLKRDYDAWKSEATRLAGRLTDLSQRASVYRHLFRASGGNHAFPLIAAHGALWAGNYFRFGLRLGECLSWQYAHRPELRQAQLQRLADFADAFRDINRRVCIDTYVNFHFTLRHGTHPEAAEFVPAELLEPLNRMHAARRQGRVLSDAEKRAVFEAHFLHEQREVVGPAIASAVEAFDWRAARFIALRPVVRFAYFPGVQTFWFRDFSHQEERIEKGLAAFGLAARVGWNTVEQALRRYRVLPNACFTQPAEYFAALRATVLNAG